MARTEQLQALQARYRLDAAAFAREIVGFSPDLWQERVLADLSDPTCKRVSVRSGQGVGKTGLEAVAMLWFLSCFPFSRVVATAPTRQQLNDVLWAEVAKWQTGSPLLSRLLKWTKTYISVTGMEKRWFATARTATKPENMQGFHEENMLFVVDEASGVADPIMEAILGTLTGSNNILLLCGNPTQTSGVFYDSHMNPHVCDLYRRHRVSSRDVMRADKELIAAHDAQYGRNSNFVRVRVDGEFPVSEDDVFIPLPLIQRSIHADRPDNSRPLAIDIAADIARYGDDVTVIGTMVDGVIELPIKRRGQDLMRTASEIALLGCQLADRYGFHDEVIPVKVDDSGVGGGVTDRLRQMQAADPERYKWMSVQPVIFGQHIRHRYYGDSTTFMMANLRDLLQGDENGPKVFLPDDDALAGQLATRKYTLTPDSRIKIESKDAFKKRGLHSPDEADCVLMLCLPFDREREKRNRMRKGGFL